MLTLTAAPNAPNCGIKIKHASMHPGNAQRLLKKTFCGLPKPATCTAKNCEKGHNIIAGMSA